ncbi:MAG: PQQ-binding-like beta-propeller repeat protein [Planctomycetes bacterium]|nr:PQQ-binding-like beta-propeller repeat protein [Planctomycetota bacterium]
MLTPVTPIARPVCTLLAASLSVAVSFTALTAGEHWPQFRGPGSRGVSEEAGLPEEWSREKNVVWKAPVPGRGWSSPVVWGGRVFVTTAVSEGDEEAPKKGLYYGGERRDPPPHPHRFLVLCFDLETGKASWEAEVHRGRPESARHLKNSYASETQVSDGERVYSYFGQLGLFAHELEGKLVWSKRLPAYKTRYGWGTAASPVLHGERVYVVNDNEEASFLAAFDRRTGAEAWRAERDEKSNWATPFVWRSPNRTEIVTPGTGKVRSYDLDGKLLWELGGMSSITIPTPFEAHGLLYLGSGFVLDQRRPIFAIRPGASGDITLKDGETSSERIAWSDPKGAPYNPSFLVAGDHLYVLFDGGFLSCHEARTGKVVYGKTRLSDEPAGFTASPWACGGKVFCLSEDGDAFVVQAGPEFKVLRKNALGEMCLATPAIARKSLVVRSLSHLWRIEAR